MVAIAYDMIRLFLGPMSMTPRGIDRVDLGYARYFAEQWPGDFGGTLPTPWGFRWFERDYVVDWLNRLDHHWQETIDGQDDRVLRYVKQRLAGTRRASGRFSGRPGHGRLAGIRDVLMVSGIAAGRALRWTAPRDCIYVNVGQLGLAAQWLLDWLQSRPDIKPVFMLHDVIPLAAPEFVTARGTHYHGRMLDNAAKFAAGMITTTRAARNGILDELRLRGNSAIPVATVPLPVAPVFLQPAPADRELQDFNYFVICGTIEPRKNHALLINVWRDLVDERGKAAPKLVIVGAPGWSAEAVLNQLRQSTSMHDHIILAAGLSTPGLRSLVAHASGLLMPSFAEGFGLPIIEALALGTPVIASDLASHRETAGNMAVYRSPIDGLGWRREIERHAYGDMAHEMRRRIAAEHRPFTSKEYFTEIAHFLETVDAEPRKVKAYSVAASNAARAQQDIMHLY